jgi:hypothetical protein
MYIKSLLFVLIISALNYAEDLAIVSISDNIKTSVGKNVDLKVVSTGATTFQWYLNGTLIPGANSAEYKSQILNISNNLAQYQVVISDGATSITSENIVVEVSPSTSQILTVSGRLNNYDGIPVTTPAIDVVVKLYNQSSNGLPIYEESFLQTSGKAVPVESGEFVLRLGTGVSNKNLIQVIGQFDNLYAEFLVGESLSALQPRVPITALPYAMSSKSKTIYGSGVPSVDAMLGHYYVNKENGQTWVKTQSSWVLLNP